MIAAFLLSLLLAASDAGGPPAPKVIQDCPSCPRMVVIPGASYSIGSPSAEEGRYPNEKVMERLEVGPFAVSETEITRGQFAEYVKATGDDTGSGCDTTGDLKDLLSDFDPKASWRNPGFEQTDDHPVVCISWYEAIAYTNWLSEKTGHDYHLPFEIAWEIAARGGTETPYFWGSSADDGCTYMNGGDLSLRKGFPRWTELTEEAFRKGEPHSVFVQCEDGHIFTAPVRSFKPNGLGLYDMTGNVWEWVVNCGDNQPDPGPDELEPPFDTCNLRRTRGGSWDDWPVDLRSAVRKRLGPDHRRIDTGFRVVREMTE